MKRILIALMILFTAGIMTSCERNIESEIVSTTPPALQVNVKNSTGSAYQGVVVKLYADEATWNTEGTPVATGQTSADGSFVYTKEVLKNPGYFYLIATDGSLKVKAKTPYLILNDGKTYFNISLK